MQQKSRFQEVYLTVTLLTKSANKQENRYSNDADNQHTIQHWQSRWLAVHYVGEGREADTKE
ncbi:hypothetical protein GCM10028807_05150 [Spirosoma daeguense]